MSSDQLAVTDVKNLSNLVTTVKRKQKRTASADIEDSILIRLRQPLDADKVRLFRLAPRTLRLFPMDLVEHSFQRLLQQLVLRTLVELANEVSAGF